MALWNPKAKAWVAGRKDFFETLQKKIIPGDRIIWVHCSSAGEFEQGKPVIEKLKAEYPSHRILVSFFSPSGFNTAKKYAHTDIITYLPVDTRTNASRFVDLVKPELVVFVKYEFWYHILNAIAYRHIPLLLVSAIFRPSQAFFKPYGGFFRRILFLFRHIFVQDDASLRLLKAQGINHSSVAGDTRFDRVTEIAGRFTEIEFIRAFSAGKPVLVAGSTWHEDEALLKSLEDFPDLKIIVAPHEIHSAHLNQILETFSRAHFYSWLKDESFATPMPGNPGPRWGPYAGEEARFMRDKYLEHHQVLVIDNIGMLSRLYHYASIAYIGGGFNKSGIHNTLEAAVYGIPVVFGPNYQKFREARDLVDKGAAFSIKDKEELTATITKLLGKEVREEAGKKAAAYVRENRGTTEKIFRFIQENRLLTS
jgi:3-deoxy-D-manno-octulosonic-acid transferase